MKAKHVTYGQLADLLTELGFEREVYDEYRVVFRKEAADSLFILPNRPPESPARESDFVVVRSQLSWRGLMEHDDFDARFAGRTIARTR